MVNHSAKNSRSDGYTKIVNNSFLRGIITKWIDTRYIIYAKASCFNTKSKGLKIHFQFYRLFFKLFLVYFYLNCIHHDLKVSLNKIVMGTKILVPCLEVTK